MGKLNTQGIPLCGHASIEGIQEIVFVKIIFRI